MAQVAQDTFVAQLADGSSLRVTRGSTWPNHHEVVRMDGGRGYLFKPLDIDGDDAPKSDPAEPGDPVAEDPPAACAAEVDPDAEGEPTEPPPPDPDPVAHPDAGVTPDDVQAAPVKAPRARRSTAKGGM